MIPVPAAPRGDLVAWLQVQMDRAERAARLVIASRHGALYTPGDSADPAMVEISGKRLLAEVDAKRLLLALHRDCGQSCYVLRVLALPDADQPGYLTPEWLP